MDLKYHIYVQVNNRIEKQKTLSNHLNKTPNLHPQIYTSRNKFQETEYNCELN